MERIPFIFRICWRPFALSSNLTISCLIDDAYRAGDFTIDEILAARDDVRNGFKCAVCFYHSMEWIYGEAAFGLRMAAFIGAHMNYEAILRFTILFARLNVVPKTWLIRPVAITPGRIFMNETRTGGQT